jgi:hypothetical protein
MTDNARRRKNLRDHDRAVTDAMEAVSNLITDAYRHPTDADTDSPWNGRPDPDLLAIAQIGASQVIALSIRSLTAHLISGLSDIADEIHRARRSNHPEDQTPTDHSARRSTEESD